MFFNTSSTLSINGTRLVGGSVRINGDKITIDGIEVGYTQEKEINIEVHGDAENIQTSNGNIIVRGNTKTVENKNGNITISSNVEGDVNNKNGSISISGSVSGSVESKNGNIKINNKSKKAKLENPQTNDNITDKKYI